MLSMKAVLKSGMSTAITALVTADSKCHYATGNVSVLMLCSKPVAEDKGH